MNYALIINNDKQQREAIAAALGIDSIASRVARSEQHAVVAVQEELPTVIVWDWPAVDMPPEIFVAVLRQEGFGGVLIICSPSMDPDGVPYDVLIRKPFHVEHLVTTIARLIDEESNQSRRTKCD